MTASDGFDQPEFTEKPATDASDASSNPPTEGYFARAKASGYLPDGEERRHALLAHLFPAMGAVVCCGMFGPVLPLMVLWFTKRRTPFEMFHMHQSVAVQLCFFAWNLLVMGVGFGGSFLGFVLFMGTITLASVVYVAMVSYVIFIGIKAYYGAWKEYAWIGRYVLNMRPVIHA